MKSGFAELLATLDGASLPSSDACGPKSMRAARVHNYGGAEAVRIDKISVPTPGPGQVRIRVIASGVNPLDWKLREGCLKDIDTRPLPFTLGSDVSGIVDQVGAAISELAKGDEVFGRVSGLSGGSFAEYVVAAELDLLKKPKRLSHLEAAALPLAGLAAHAALIRDQLLVGARVLILGGAGGVGHLAVQLAKLQGAWVAATAARSNLEFVHSLGADLVIEGSHPDLTTLLDPVDLIVDTVGPAALAPAWDVLKRGGRVRSIVAGAQAGSSRDREAVLVSVSNDRTVLAELARQVAAGQMRIEIPRVFPLIEVERALSLSRSDHARGKIVLSIY